MENKNVNHPSHYNHEGRKECWDEWVDKYGQRVAIIICLGCADKYLYRAGTKADNSAEQDIAKAKAFCAKALSIIDTYTLMPLPRDVQHLLDVVMEELEKYDTI